MKKEQDKGKPSSAVAKTAEKTTRQRKKNVIKLKGEGLSGSNTVQMAQELYHMISTASLSLNSFKLLDVYLSKINSHDASRKTVVFEFGEVEKLFGLKQIRKEALQSQLQELLTISVILSAETETEETSHTKFKSMLLFDKAELEQDKTDGLWKVTMICSDEAEPFMFNIDSKGYLQHALQNSVRLPNAHSFLLFKFIESRRDNSRGYPQVFEITVENLRAALNSTIKSHSQFKKFNAEYLKPCREDIQENTDTRFDYEPIKKGNRIYKVKFTIYERAKKNLLLNTGANINLTTEPATDTAAVPLQAEVTQAEPNRVDNIENSQTTSSNPHYYYGNSFDATSSDNNETFTSQVGLSKEIKLLAAACDNEFSPRQMETIAGFIGFFIQDEMAKYTYLRGVYEKLNSADVSSEEDRFLRLRKFIESDPELLSRSSK